MRRNVALLALLAALVASALLPAAASAANCASGATAWTGGGSDGDFSNAMNWDNGVPAGSCTASIAGAAVRLEGGSSFAGLSLTAGASLSITGYTDANGNAAQSSLTTNATTVASGSAIHLTSTNADLSSGTHAINPGAAILAGIVTNSGAITTDIGQTGANTYRDIRANVTNNPGGTITMHTDMGTCGCGSGGTWINNGTITTDVGTTSTFTRTGAGIAFSQPQASGTFADNGHALIAGTFTNSAGSTTGNPIQLAGALDASSAAPARFEFDTAAALGSSGGTLTGDIGAQTTVQIHNDTAANSSINVSVPVDLTNRGTLTLNGGPGQDQLNGSGGHTLTNAGTLNLSADSSAPSMHISTAITNTGTITQAANTSADINAPFAQSAGTFTINAGATFSASNTVTLSGGTIANSGTFNGGAFTDTGGSITGNRVLLCGGTLTAPGTGAARFEIVDNAGCNGGSIADGSTIGSGADVLLRSFAAVNDLGSGSFTNDGTVTVQSSTGHLVQLHGGTLTNNGTLSLIGSTIAVALVNNGTTTISADPTLTTNFDGRYGPITQAGGSFTVPAGGSVNIGNLTMTGGTLANGGSILATGDLVASGGHATGNPATFSANVTLSGSGTGTYDTTGVNLLSDVPAGYDLILDGDVNVSPSAGAVNHGTVDFRGGGGHSNLHGNAFDNQGTVKVTPAAGSSKVINSAFSNEGTMDVGDNLGVTNAFVSSGTIDVHGGSILSTNATFTQTAGTTMLDGPTDTLTAPNGATVNGGTLGGAGIVNANLTNAGTVSPSPSPATLSVSGTYTQTSNGFLTAGVDASGNDRLAVTGMATLDGTLQVSTASVYAPPADQAYNVLDAQSRSGTFATTAGLASGPYTLGYTGTSAVLTAQGRPAVTPPPSATPPAPAVSIGDATVANPETGSTTASFTLTLSAPSSTPVTVHYQTSNGTASAPDDYQAASGTVTFAPGQTTATIPVTVFGTAKPGLLAFFVDLSSPSSGTSLFNARGTGTITGSPSLSSVSPAAAGNGGSAVITVTGTGLSSADQLALTTPGRPAITATGVSASSDGRALTATVALNGAPLGARTVQVTTGAGQGTTSLPNAFTIERATAPDVIASIAGPAQTRPSGGWYGNVYLTNLGNTDAVNTLVRVDGLPTGVNVAVTGADGPGVQSDAGVSRSVTFLVHRVGAAGETTVGIAFTLSDLAASHHIVAAMSATVLKATDPGLVYDPNGSTSLSGYTVSGGHVQFGLHFHNRQGSGDLHYDLSAVAPPPAGRPVVTFTRRADGGLSVKAIVSVPPNEGCIVSGDPYASLNWDCAGKRPAASCDYLPVQCAVYGGTLSAPAFVAHAARVAHAAGVGHWLEVGLEYGPKAYEAWKAKEAYISEEVAERRELNECLAQYGFINGQNRNLLDTMASAESGFEYTSFGQSVGEILISRGGLPLPLGASLGMFGAMQLTGSAVQGSYTEQLGLALNRAIADNTLMSSDWPTDAQGRVDPSGSRLNPLQRFTVTNRSFPTARELERLTAQAELLCRAREYKKLPPTYPGSDPNQPHRNVSRSRLLLVTLGLALDPNSMAGPQGPGRAVHYLAGVREPLSYTAHFENLPTAQLAVDRVVVTDKVPANRLNLATVALGPVTFGSYTVSPPAGLQQYSTIVDLRPASNQLVQITGRLDRQTGVITWVFVALDPNTHQPVTTAASGFLPPDKLPPAGQGSVSFTAMPAAAGLRDRSRTANAATIVFDTNQPITTNTWLNAVDRTHPTSRLTRIRTLVRRRVHELVLRYRGHDRGSGVSGFYIYSARKGSRRFALISAATPRQSVTVTCSPGSRYRFQILAVDRVGNVQTRATKSRPVRCR